MKNQTAKTAKQVASKVSEKRVSIGEATFQIVSEHLNAIQNLSAQLEHEKQSLNRIVTSCLEGSGVKIKEGMNTSFDAENKQFIIV